MPNRILKREYVYSDRLAAVPLEHEAVYVRLLTCVDDFGRMECSMTILQTKMLGARLGQVGNGQLCQMLQELIDHDIICVYKYEKRLYLSVQRFFNTPRAKHSLWPDPKTCAHVRADEIICALNRNRNRNRNEERKTSTSSSPTAKPPAGKFELAKEPVEKKPKPKPELWQAIRDTWGLAEKTTTQCRRIQKLFKEFEGKGAKTRADLEAAAAWAVRQWPNAKFGPDGVLKHYEEFKKSLKANGGDTEAGWWRSRGYDVDKYPALLALKGRIRPGDLQSAADKSKGDAKKLLELLNG